MSKLAFIFPGQGAQKAGMGKDFYENSEAARSFFDNAQKILDFDLKEMCFGEHEELNLTEYTQPCMVSVCLAIVQELKKRGITPDITAGMKTTDFTDFEILESFENVWIANYNCPGQIVITGLTNEVQQASLALKEAGAKRVVELKVSGPFHSLLLKPAGEALLKEMESMSFSTLQVPYVANATAEIVTDSKKISTFFAKGIYSSVRWQQSIETMLENGVDTFVEIGPGKTLAGFMRKIAPKATVYNVSSFEDAIALEKCLSKA